MAMKSKGDTREGRVVEGEPQNCPTIRDPAAAGLALVRAAAAVLHERGDLAQITPGWVEAYVRVDRKKVTTEDE